MIPNLTIMICAYVVFRCIESFVEQMQKPNRSVGGVIVLIGALLCALVAVGVTAETISAGSSMQQPPSP
jgi:hypothetical protein